MENFTDNIVYIIVTIIIFVVSAINGAKKKKQKIEDQKEVLVQQPVIPNIEPQGRFKQEKRFADYTLEVSTASLEQIVDEASFSIESDDYVPRKKISKIIVKETPEEEVYFDLKDAIIKSEILNRKYS